MKVICTLISEMLGTASADPKIYADYIFGKYKGTDKACRLKEEIESLKCKHMEDGGEEVAAEKAAIEEVTAKGITIFRRNDDDCPILLDYQIKGFFKTAFRSFVDFREEITINKRKGGGVKIGSTTYKRVVDTGIFVSPRQIPLVIPEGGNIAIVERPLRIDSFPERTAIATSETVPVGTRFEFTVTAQCPELYPHIKEALNYGECHGMGAWRGGGHGRFTWQEMDS